MTTPKSRAQNNAGTTADSRQAEEPPREDAENDKPSGKQTVESSREAASLGKQPTRDDGSNDAKGELK